MLVIKDSVDLKELKKFGFKVLIPNDKRMKYGSKRFWDTLAYKDIDECFKIEICNDEYIREINIIPINTKCPFNMTVTYQLDTIFDLIQAGLVEKVEE